MTAERQVERSCFGTWRLVGTPAAICSTVMPSQAANLDLHGAWESADGSSSARVLWVLLLHRRQAPPAGGLQPAPPWGQERPLLLLLLADLSPDAVAAAARCVPAALHQGATAVVLLHRMWLRLISRLGTPRPLQQLPVQGRVRLRHHEGLHRGLHGLGRPRLRHVPILNTPAHACELGPNELDALLHDAAAMTVQPCSQRGRSGAALRPRETWGAARLPAPG